MDNDLNEIKARFNRIEKRRLIRWLIALTVALLLCAGVLMLRSGKKRNLFAFLPHFGGAKGRPNRLNQTNSRLRQNVENSDLQGVKGTFQI